jgi:hypothetical protein
VEKKSNNECGKPGFSLKLIKGPESVPEPVPGDPEPIQADPLHRYMEAAWERMEAAKKDPDMARQVHEIERARYRTSIADRHDAVNIPAIHGEAIRSGKDEHGKPIRELDIDVKLRAAIASGKRIVYLVGHVGTGKTLAACKWAVGQQNYTLYIKAMSYCNLVKSRRPLERYRNCQVLILDEIGMEREFDADIIADLIHHRYEECLTTVGISNMDPSKITGHYGDPIARRTWAAGAVIKCDVVVCPGQERRDSVRDK